MVRTFVVSALAAALCVACGGSAKEAQEPEVAVDEEEPVEEPQGDVLIPPEKLDEVKAFFDRKARMVSRCWVSAMDAGEVDANARGTVTVWMTIQPSGKPTDVQIKESRPKSKTLEDCVLDQVGNWTLPTLPRAMEYAYQFGFEQL